MPRAQRVVNKSVNSYTLRNWLFYTLNPSFHVNCKSPYAAKSPNTNARKYAHIWPIDPNSAAPPPGWKGWPDGKQFALVLSHDVDNQKGQERVLELAKLEMKLGFRSAFNFVPERYTNHEKVKSF